MHYRCGKTKHTAVVCSCGEKDGADWVSECRSFEVNGVSNRGRGRETWDECVKILVALGLHQE